MLKNIGDFVLVVSNLDFGLYFAGIMNKSSANVDISNGKRKLCIDVRLTKYFTSKF